MTQPRAFSEIAAEPLDWSFEVEGFPLADVGLDGAMLVFPDGRKEPFTGFVHDEETLAASIRRALAEGAILIDREGRPITLVD
jgi:hypothetical protein